MARNSVHLMRLAIFKSCVWTMHMPVVALWSCLWFIGIDVRMHGLIIARTGTMQLALSSLYLLQNLSALCLEKKRKWWEGIFEPTIFTTILNLSLSSAFFLNVHARGADSPSLIALLLVTYDVWKFSFIQYSEIMEQIDRDVKRTHPDMHFFCGDSSFAKSNQVINLQALWV